MSRTRVSTPPRYEAQPPVQSMELAGGGLVEAAFEGRLDRRGRSLAARAPVADVAEPTAGLGRAAIPLHVSGGPGHELVRLVESRSPRDPEDTTVADGLARAVGFLAVVLAVLLVMEFLHP